MTLSVSVIVPTVGRFEPLLDTLTYMLDQTYERFELIVVDQNVEWPAAHWDRKELISADPRVIWTTVRPAGVVAARQYGVEVARGDIFLFIDDDVAIHDVEFIEKHVANFRDGTVAAVCGREVHSPTGDPEALRQKAEIPPEFDTLPPAVQPLVFPRNATVRRFVSVFCTCNSSVRRTSFMKVGGFDENFKGASYGDDFDFAIRLFQAGGVIVFDPTAQLIHLRAPAGGLRLSRNARRFSEFDKALSGWLFLLRHGQSGWKWYLLWNWVLRRTLFLKENTIRIWRWPLCVFGISSAYLGARHAVRLGPRSRFAR